MSKAIRLVSDGSLRAAWSRIGGNFSCCHAGSLRCGRGTEIRGI